MKKKLLLFTVLLLALSLSFLIGSLLFSLDNLENAREERFTEKYADGTGLEFYDWEYHDGVYLSKNDSQLIISGVNAYVHNIRIDGKLINHADYVEIFYTAKENGEFNVENYKLSVVEIKNNDIYLSLDEYVYDVRIDIFPSAGSSAEINSVELNPTKLNFDTVKIILTFFFTLAIGYSLIELFYNREGLKKDIFAIKRYRFLLSDLVVKDIKTKYRRSALGVLWSVLNPLLMMLVLTAVFSNIIRVEVEGGFALFYLTGYIMYNFISESTGFCLTSVINASGLIKKVYIPKYIFPLQKTLFSFVNMVFSLSAFVIVFVFFLATGAATLKWTMLLFFVPMIYIFVFAFGLNLILATANVFFRDVGHIWGILLTVWMYASPIIYPITMVPIWLANIIKLNPLYYYIDYFRSVMLYGTLPSLSDNLICIFYALAILLLGVVIFHKKQDKFVLYI